MILTLVAVGLLVAGVVGSLVPRVPGAALSLLGVYLYWGGTGFDAPGTLTVVLLTLVGLLALAGRLIGPVVAARMGGASTVNATIAGLVGVVAFFVFSLPGLIVATLVTVFVLELRRQKSVSGGIAAASAVVLGTFATKVLQVLLTSLMLVVMLVVIVF